MTGEKNQTDLTLGLVQIPVALDETNGGVCIIHHGCLCNRDDKA